jgi:hypothetical protein
VQVHELLLEDAMLRVFGQVEDRPKIGRPFTQAGSEIGEPHGAQKAGLEVRTDDQEVPVVTPPDLQGRGRAHRLRSVALTVMRSLRIFVDHTDLGRSLDQDGLDDGALAKGVEPVKREAAWTFRKERTSASAKHS